MTSLRAVPISALLLFVSACGGGDAPPTPAKSSAPATVSAAPAASAAPGSTCPEGSSGKGTAQEPCTGTGELIEAVWTKKIEKSGAVFKLTNKTNHAIRFVWQSTYYYDEAGNQLEITFKNPKQPKEKRYSASGGVVSLKPAETKEVALGASEEIIPPGTKNIETVYDKVGWPPDGDPEADSSKWTYWKNDKLAPRDRKMGAK